ncbi:MFS transporter [Streptomyces sp. NPDC055955]|uniref:MFS transporter n=1 Tax=Streptomyces sp. NPDC055955 TaxID=3345665 RepID=UPI0035D897C9
MVIVVVEDSVHAKVGRRIIPLLFALWLVNFLDRANVGFAALQMNEELQLSPAVYGFGAGAFFFGYLALEVPANMLLLRYGARRWIARIAITWGIVSMAQALVVGPTSFVAVRVALGFAEAGFLPAMLYYLTLWFPAERRAKAIGQAMSANVIAIVVGAPLSGLMLTYLNGIAGLGGWQWLFVVEGALAVVLGFVTLRSLTERPAEARWLAEEERSWLVARMAEDATAAGTQGHHSLKDALRLPIVYLLGALYFCWGIGFYGVTLWAPQIVAQLSSGSLLQTSLLTAVPFTLGAVAVILNGRHSDRTGERRWHVTIPLLTGALGLVAGSVVPGAAASFAALCVTVAGLSAGLGVFWSVPSQFLVGRAAAGGLAVINTISSFSGFCGPYLVGFVRGSTGSFTAAMVVLGASAGVAALLSVVLLRRLRPAGAKPPIAAQAGLPEGDPVA